MTDDASPDDGAEAPYEVGYGRPPKHTRFRPGRSGNPAGRPPGSKNFKALLEQHLNERVVVTERGKQRSRTKREIASMQLANKSAGGDLKALGMALGILGPAEPVTPDFGQGSEAEDDAVLASLVERMSWGKR